MKTVKILLSVVLAIIMIFVGFITIISLLAHLGILPPSVRLMPYIITTVEVYGAELVPIEGVISVHGGTLKQEQILITMKNEKITRSFCPLIEIAPNKFYFCRFVATGPLREYSKMSPLHRVKIIHVPKEKFEMEKFPYIIYCSASGYKCVPEKKIINGPCFLEFRLIKIK